jgi:hypothetical protein
MVCLCIFLTEPPFSFFLRFTSTPDTLFLPFFFLRILFLTSRASRVPDKTLDSSINRARARTRIFLWRAEPSPDFDTRHELEPSSSSWTFSTSSSQEFSFAELELMKYHSAPSFAYCFSSLVTFMIQPWSITFLGNIFRNLNFTLQQVMVVEDIFVLT